MMALARTSAVVLLIRYCVCITSIHTSDDKRTSLRWMTLYSNPILRVVKETPAEVPNEPISALVQPCHDENNYPTHTHCALTRQHVSEQLTRQCSGL